MYCASDEVSLRRARPADAARIAAIDPSAAAGRYLRICEEGRLTTGRIELAESGDRVCGFVLYTLVLDEGSINNIVVEPGCRGRGLGRRLLRHAMDLMRQSGAVRCLLEVRESNAVAIGLYRGEGFVLDGRRNDYYPAGSGAREDALLMSRQL